jgi:hypothetical protein
MAIPHMPQLLDYMPPRKAPRSPFSCVFLQNQHSRLIGAFSSTPWRHLVNYQRCPCGGEFRLINFAQSGKHICVENDRQMAC